MPQLPREIPPPQGITQPEAGLKTKLGSLALLAVLGFTAFWLLSAPRPLPASAIPAHAGNIANGEFLYTAGGCRNCHKPNAEQAGLDPNLPSGGFPLKTPIGVLYPPNLTPDAQTGIGNWSTSISSTPCSAAFRNPASISFRPSPTPPMRPCPLKMFSISRPTS